MVKCFGIQLNETEVRGKFEILYDITVESRLQAFHYLIIQRALVTNETPYLWKTVNSNLCQMSHQHTETTFL